MPDFTPAYQLERLIGNTVRIWGRRTNPMFDSVFERVLQGIVGLFCIALTLFKVEKCDFGDN